MANPDVPYRGQAVSRAQLKINRENGVKYCHVCKETKPFECFAKSAGRSDGFNPVCRECVAKQRKARHEANPNAAKEKSAAYRAANRDKVNADTRKRYHANPEHARELSKSKRAKNPELYRDLGRRWREANREKANEAARLAHRKKREANPNFDRAYREANKEKKAAYEKARRQRDGQAINARIRVRHQERMVTDPAYRLRKLAESAKWHKEHPDAINAIRAKRRARKMGAEGFYTAEDIAKLRKRQKDRCAHPWCRAKLYGAGHRDHIIALARGGTNWPRNIQLLCGPCNCKKHAKDPITVAQENGMLL
jgi:DNA polymerase III gamma/tau subunit